MVVAELEQTELEADCLYELCPALPVTKSCFVTQTCSLSELKLVLRISLRWYSQEAEGGAQRELEVGGGI